MPRNHKTTKLTPFAFARNQFGSQGMRLFECVCAQCKAYRAKFGESFVVHSAPGHGRYLFGPATLYECWRYYDKR
jgi:hypothetical protein